MEAGIIENPIPTINTINDPFYPASLSLSFLVTGIGEFITSNLKLGLPVAALNIASYAN